MTTRQLPVVECNADLELESFVQRVPTNSASRQDIERICRAYRVRGLARFFMSADPSELHEDLQRSGAAYLHFVTHGLASHFVVSKADPFFDAICSGDMKTAGQIARALETTPFARAEEYEDEYLYVRFLMARFFSEASEAALDELVGRMEKLVGDGWSARIDLCKALRVKSPEVVAALQVALTHRIEEHEERFESLRQAGAVLEEDWATSGQLFVEGLAIIRLAEQVLGVQMPEGFRLIPHLARRAPRIDRSEDSWRTP